MWNTFLRVVTDIEHWKVHFAHFQTCLSKLDNWRGEDGFSCSHCASFGKLQLGSVCLKSWSGLTLLKRISFLSARSRRAKSSSVKTTKWLKLLSLRDEYPKVEHRHLSWTAIRITNGMCKELEMSPCRMSTGQAERCWYPQVGRRVRLHRKRVSKVAQTPEVTKKWVLFWNQRLRSFPVMLHVRNSFW